MSNTERRLIELFTSSTEQLQLNYADGQWALYTIELEDYEVEHTKIIAKGSTLTELVAAPQT